MHRLWSTLRDAHGAQNWWPADSRFEVLTGAVLIQNTAWTNVEKAIANLRSAGLLDAGAVLALPQSDLGQIIRPAGTFNVKAKRLQALCGWFHAEGGFEVLDTWSTAHLRTALLDVHGVGRETADAILVYAFQRPVFVVDAYARRIFGRFGLLPADLDYETLRASVENAVSVDADWFNEFHALLVAHAKVYCRARPRCMQCPLSRTCAGSGHVP